MGEQVHVRTAEVESVTASSTSTSLRQDVPVPRSSLP